MKWVARLRATMTVGGPLVRRPTRQRLANSRWQHEDARMTAFRVATREASYTLYLLVWMTARHRR